MSALPARVGAGARLRLAAFALRRATPLGWIALAFALGLVVGRPREPFAPLAELARARPAPGAREAASSEANAPPRAEAARLDAAPRTTETAPTPAQGADPAQLTRAAGRASAFAWLLLAAAPALLLGCARLGASAAGARGAWLAARPLGPAGASAALVLGALGGAVLVLALACAAAELGRSAPAPVLARVAFSAPPASAAPWLDARHPVQLLGLRPPPSARELSVELALGGGAPVAPVEARLASASGASTAAVARVLGRGELRIALPAGGAPYSLELSTAHPRAALRVLVERVQAWRTLADERAATLRLALHAASGACWLVLALGLGAWLRASLSAAFVLCLAGAWATLQGAAPGAQVAEALELVARARAPAWPDAQSWLASALVLALGALALGGGLARRRA